MITRIDYLVEPLTYSDLKDTPEVKKLEYKFIRGIYFLIDKKTVVYVGQSQDIIQRINQHTDKTFTSVLYIESNVKDLTKLETHYIVAFDPKYNKTHYSTIMLNDYRLKHRRPTNREKKIYKNFSPIDACRCLDLKDGIPSYAYLQVSNHDK